VNDGPTQAASVADLLLRALDRADSASFTFADLVEAGGERAFVLLLVLMNLPNVVFAPPVVAGAVAVPTLLFGVQLMAGRAKPRLPDWLLRRNVAVKPLRKVLDIAGPGLRRLEALGRPRLPLLADLARPLLGLFSVLAGLIILLPIPGTNVLPALSIAVLGVGALRRDGLLVLLGIGAGLAGLVVLALAAGLLVKIVRLGLASL
jgi:hypothetical protein